MILDGQLLDRNQMEKADFNLHWSELLSGSYSLSYEDYHRLIDIHGPSNELIKALLTRTPDYIKYIEQTEENCFTALSIGGHVIHCIENPTEEMWILAVKKNPFCLESCPCQTYEMCLEAVSKCWQALEYVKILQTYELCMEAVKVCGIALQHVKIPQTEEMCMTAIKSWGPALKYVHNKTPEMCYEAVKHYGSAIEYVLEQTEELCWMAIKNTPYIIYCIENPTDEMLAFALCKSPWVINRVKHPLSDDVKWALIKDNVENIEFIKNPTEEMLWYVIKSNKSVKLRRKTKLKVEMIDYLEQNNRYVKENSIVSKR